MNYMLTPNEQVLDTFKPSKKVYFFWYWVLLILCGLVFLIASIIAVANGEFGTIFGLLFALGIPLGLVYLFLYICYKNTVYLITNKNVIIRHGFIAYGYRAMPIESITAIDIEVSLFDRILGGTTGSVILANDSNHVYSMLSLKKGYSVFHHVDFPVQKYLEIKNLTTAQAPAKHSKKPEYSAPVAPIMPTQAPVATPVAPVQPEYTQPVAPSAPVAPTAPVQPKPAKAGKPAASSSIWVCKHCGTTNANSKLFCTKCRRIKD